ncbi:MAG: asparagine synthetase B family protein [bacterium]
MSGICGVFTSSPEAISEAAVSGMLESMKHRGPDGNNVYANGGAGIALGQNHLNAFAGAAETSAPAFGRTDDFVIALEGCVTNRAELFQGPPPHRLNPDVEAVLAAYQAHGVDCLSKLDGPFSVALWDKRERQLLLSRDKLGEKALYYFIDPAQKYFIFASEIKAILAHRSVRAELDADSLALYFAFGYIPGAKTLFKDIYKLLPGESLQIGPAIQPQKKKYWHLPPIAGSRPQFRADRLGGCRRLRGASQILGSGKARRIGTKNPRMQDRRRALL